MVIFADLCDGHNIIFLEKHEQYVNNMKKGSLDRRIGLEEICYNSNINLNFKKKNQRHNP